MSSRIVLRRNAKRARVPFGDNALEALLFELQKTFTGSATSVTAQKNAECLAEANAKTAALDAKITDLNKNWNPTGFYTQTQVTGLLQNVQGMLRQASSTLDQQMLQPTAEGDRDALQMSKTEIARKMADSLIYVRAAQQATEQGINVIDAPGLKRFLVNAMLTASNAMTSAAYVSCQRPWFVSALAVFQVYFDAVWNVARAIVGTAVALGEKVLEIPDTISTLWKYTKWGALIVGGYFAYTKGPKLLRDLSK